MAFVVPFRGQRFDTTKTGSLDEVITPPYDVINEKKQRALEARNPYNMIKLDISKSPGPVSDGDDRYLRAKQYFEEWQRQGILIRDPQPAMYLYHVDYGLPSGKRLTRRGLIALVELSEFSEGIIKPHEETFVTVTSDRLRLLDACRAQFSQIFSLYGDEHNEIVSELERHRSGEPICRAVDNDGAVHTVWSVTDPASLVKVQAMFQSKALYIADGHHRYATALQFKKVMEERTGGLASDSPYRFVMMYLCAMEDPGLSVLPTHRLLYMPADLLPEGEKGLDSILRRLAAGFDLEEIGGGSRETLVGEVLARLDEYNRPHSLFGLYHPGADRCFLLRLKEGAMDRYSRRERSPVLRELDVVVLSDLVVESFLGLGQERCEDENLIHYFSDPDEALDAAVKRSIDDSDLLPLLFLMNNTRVEQVKKVADAQLIMPHKSTYFYPKILTGLVINKLDDRPDKEQESGEPT